MTAPKKRMRGVRSMLWLALLIVGGWGTLTTYQRATRNTQILGETTCPFTGVPQVTIAASVVPADTAPVRAHEAVHAEQCRTLGPWRYRYANLTSEGKLALEAPAYCAGAESRLRQGEDAKRVARRLRDDTVESMRGIVDSASVIIALLKTCGRLLGP
jgi:hypothetical protein